MAKISAYSALTNVQPNDLLVVVDVHDTTMAPTGTTKNMTLSQLAPLQPWQFLPETYGAVGNGKIISDVVLASNTTLTSASASFTSGDTGKTIMINGGAGNAGGPLVTTITFVNSTTVTLGSGASVSGSAFVAVYGTDDTSSINTCLSAGATYATTLSATPGSGNYFFEVIFGPKIYMLTSGPTQTTSPTSQNSQIIIPWPNVNGTTRKLVVALTGAGDNGYYQYWESLTPNAAGTTLMSTTTAPTSPSGTYGEQSVIGGPSAGGAFTGGYSNVKVVVRNMEVMCGAYTNQYAYDFGCVSAMRIQQSSAHIFAPTGVGGSPPGPLLKNLPGDSNFVAKIGTGLRSPIIGNNADITCDDFTVEGYSRGLYVFDHFTATRIGTIYNDVPLIIDTTQGSGGISHGVHIDLLGAEVYNGGILTIGSAAYCPVYLTLDAEVSEPNYDVHDVGNVLAGEIHWTDPADTRAPIITGAANVKIINDKLGPGQWTGGMTPAVPAVPGSGTAATNTAYRDATVYLTSGGAAVTAVAVGTVNTGLVLATTGTVTYRVPGGQATTLTYASSAPTWIWWLD